MILSYKVRILPTCEQESLIMKSIGAVRFAYNWGLEKQRNNFENNEKFITWKDEIYKKSRGIFPCFFYIFPYLL